jgi:hypothetical protein
LIRIDPPAPAPPLPELAFPPFAEIALVTVNVAAEIKIIPPPDAPDPNV